MAEKQSRRRWIVRVLATLAVLFVVAQFFPAERTNPPVISEVDAPPAVRAVLERSCFDCHSHETRWPWYSRIAPVSWWLAHHVDEARGDLNFSDWPLYDFEAQTIALGEIREEVEEGEMPLKSYLIIHRSARLSEEDRRLLLDWTAIAGTYGEPTND